MKSYNRAYNQLGRLLKNDVFTAAERKALETIRENLYDKKKGMDKMAKIKGLEEARETWNVEENAVRIYYDMENNEVWAMVYTSLTSWDEYHNDQVIEVMAKESYPLSSRNIMSEKRFKENILESVKEYKFYNNIK